MNRKMAKILNATKATNRQRKEFKRLSWKEKTKVRNAFRSDEKLSLRQFSVYLGCV